jgi:hypothetical protein
MGKEGKKNERYQVGIGWSPRMPTTVQDGTLWVNVSMATEKLIKGEGEVDWLIIVMVVEKEKLITHDVCYFGYELRGGLNKSVIVQGYETGGV